MKLPQTFAGLINQSKESGQQIEVMFSVLCPEEDTKRYRNLLKETKEIIFFENNGVFYKGKRSIAAIHFMLDNPSKADFCVWLDNNYERYCPIS